MIEDHCVENNIIDEPEEKPTAETVEVFKLKLEFEREEWRLTCEKAQRACDAAEAEAQRARDAEKAARKEAQELRMAELKEARELELKAE